MMWGQDSDDDKEEEENQYVNYGYESDEGEAGGDTFSWESQDRDRNALDPYWSINLISFTLSITLSIVLFRSYMTNF